MSKLFLVLLALTMRLPSFISFGISMSQLDDCSLCSAVEQLVIEERSELADFLSTQSVKLVKSLIEALFTMFKTMHADIPEGPIECLEDFDPRLKLIPVEQLTKEVNTTIDRIDKIIAANDKMVLKRIKREDVSPTLKPDEDSCGMGEYLDIINDGYIMLSKLIFERAFFVTTPDRYDPAEKKKIVGNFVQRLNIIKDIISRPIQIVKKRNGKTKTPLCSEIAQPKSSDELFVSPVGGNNNPKVKILNLVKELFPFARPVPIGINNVHAQFSPSYTKDFILNDQVKLHKNLEKTHDALNKFKNQPYFSEVLDAKTKPAKIAEIRYLFTFVTKALSVVLSLNELRKKVREEKRSVSFKRIIEEMDLDHNDQDTPTLLSRCNMTLDIMRHLVKYPHYHGIQINLIDDMSKRYLWSNRVVLLAAEHSVAFLEESPDSPIIFENMPNVFNPDDSKFKLLGRMLPQKGVQQRSINIMCALEEHVKYANQLISVASGLLNSKTNAQYNLMAAQVQKIIDNVGTTMTKSTTWANNIIRNMEAKNEDL